MPSDPPLSAYLELSAEGQRLVASGAKSVNANAHAALIHKGQAVAGAYLVTAGRLRVFTYTPQGKEATLYLIGAGETCVLALNCLFNDLRYPAWVEAVEDSSVSVIPGPLYRQLFAREPAIQSLTVEALSTVVFRLMRELEQVHCRKLDQRLADFLLTSANGDGCVAMTQQQLAAHLGTTREVIARLVQRFTREGLVRTGRGRITLLNAERLATLALGRD